MGFRADGTRNARTCDSAEEARYRGSLPLCAEPNVPRVHRWMDRSLDRVRKSNPIGHCDRLCGRARSRLVRGALRGTHATPEVRHQVPRILPERTPLDTSSTSMAFMKLDLGTWQRTIKAAGYFEIASSQLLTALSVLASWREILPASWRVRRFRCFCVPCPPSCPT
jgi:hypothetical protein